LVKLENKQDDTSDKSAEDSFSLLYRVGVKVEAHHYRAQENDREDGKD